MVTKFKSYLLQRTSLVHAIFTHREQVWAIFTHRGQVYAPHFISLWRYLHVDDKFVGAWVCIKLYFFYINICLLGFCISKYTYAMLTKLTPCTPGPSLHEKKLPDHSNVAVNYLVRPSLRATLPNPTLQFLPYLHIEDKFFFAIKWSFIN
jgi:hypothetical protein